MYVIVTNHVNWDRENLQSDRENTGFLKMKFEWVPWLFLLISDKRHFSFFTKGVGIVVNSPKTKNKCQVSSLSDNYQLVILSVVYFHRDLSRCSHVFYAVQKVFSEQYTFSLIPYVLIVFCM